MLIGAHEEKKRESDGQVGRKAVCEEPCGTAERGQPLELDVAGPAQVGQPELRRQTAASMVDARSPGVPAQESGGVSGESGDGGDDGCSHDYFLRVVFNALRILMRARRPR